VDLTKGPDALKIFEMSGYDFVLCLATYHKLKRAMPAKELTTLMQFFGNWTKNTSRGGVLRTSRKRTSRRSSRSIAISRRSV